MDFVDDLLEIAAKTLFALAISTFGLALCIESNNQQCSTHDVWVALMAICLSLLMFELFVMLFYNMLVHCVFKRDIESAVISV